MNGRIYDPLLGRFLSADVLVQAPGDLQAYNRYSYVKNNPLTLTDPSGFAWDDELVKKFKEAGKTMANLFTQDRVKESRGGYVASEEEQPVRNALKGAVQKQNEGLQVLADGTSGLVKNTPVLGQVVSGGELLTGKNILDPTGRTSANRTQAASELGGPLVAGAAVKTTASLLGKAGKFAGRLENNAPDVGKVDYGKLDSLNRPTGVKATITGDMIGTGTPAARSIKPPGFEGGAAGQARGHLLGNQLGGSGDEARNLVTLAQNPTNTPDMLKFENQIRSIVEGGETFTGSFTPVYRGDKLTPIAITIMGEGSEGSLVGVSILNQVK